MVGTVATSLVSDLEEKRGFGASATLTSREGEGRDSPCARHLESFVLQGGGPLSSDLPSVFLNIWKSKVGNS